MIPDKLPPEVPIGAAIIEQLTDARFIRAVVTVMFAVAAVASAFWYPDARDIVIPLATFAIGSYFDVSQNKSTHGL